MPLTAVRLVTAFLVLATSSRAVLIGAAIGIGTRRPVLLCRKRMESRHEQAKRDARGRLAAEVSTEWRQSLNPVGEFNPVPVDTLAIVAIASRAELHRLQPGRR